MLNKMKKKSVIWGWLISYIIVLMIPLISVFVNYNINSKTIRQGLMDANELICQNLKNSIGDYLRMEEKACNWIFGNEKMWYVSRSREKDSYFYYGAVELQQQIANYCLDNRDLQCLVYFTGTDYIVTDDTSNDSYYYYNSIRNTYPEVEDYEAWKEKIGADYKKQFFVSKWIGNDSKDDFLSYANSFYAAGAKVNVIISIPLKCIEQQISYLKNGVYLIIGLGEEYLCFDNKGYTKRPDFVSIGENGELILAEEGFLSQAESDSENSDRYWLLSTAKQMEKDLEDTRHSFLINLVVTVLFGLVGIEVLLFQNYQPVRKLSKEAESITGTANEFDRLEQFFRKIATEKQYNLEVLKRQRDDLQSSWLLEVMKGRIFDQQADERKQFFEEHLGGGVGLVGFMLPLADSENIEHDELMFFVVNNIFEELISGQTIYHIEDGRYVFYLFEIAADNMNDWQQQVFEYVDYLCNLLNDKWNTELIGVVSEPAESMASLKFLYKNVVAALEYQDLIGAGQATIAQTAIGQSDMAGFRKIIEVDISIAIMEGKQEEVVAIIDRLFDERKGYPLVTLQFYSCEIFNVVLEYFDDCVTSLQKRAEMFGYMNRITQATDAVEINKTLKKLLQFYFKEITEYSKYEGNNIVVKIQEYVEENYTDSNLNVNAIADVFQRNQKYISRIFKEETGVGLLTYINNFRVYKAQKLIQENKGTLEEIALQVGFNNACTFRRAWNRVNGDLPEG